MDCLPCERVESERLPDVVQIFRNEICVLEPDKHRDVCRDCASADPPRRRGARRAPDQQARSIVHENAREHDRGVFDLAPRIKKDARQKQQAVAPPSRRDRMEEQDARKKDEDKNGGTENQIPNLGKKLRPNFQTLEKTVRSAPQLFRIREGWRNLRQLHLVGRSFFGRLCKRIDLRRRVESFLAGEQAFDGENLDFREFFLVELRGETPGFDGFFFHRL